jgi:hypothetical protein
MARLISKICFADDFPYQKFIKELFSAKIHCINIIGKDLTTISAT